jgi:hypothetical protein
MDLCRTLRHSTNLSRQRTLGLPSARRRALALVFATIACIGCGDDGHGASAAEDPAVATSEEPLYWEPSSALVTEHVNWHTAPCGTGGGRACTKRGEDFLIFHRNFLSRLRDDYLRKLLPAANIEPWYALPAEMKSSNNGWKPEYQEVEDNLHFLIDDFGQPFPSLDAFGTYLEEFYHSRLHKLAQNAYATNCPNTWAEADDTTNDCIVLTWMSPKSTYFFKIHGLVDMLFERFEGGGDFNRDGKSDLFVRHNTNGENKIKLLNGTTTTSTVSLPNVATTCGDYVGAAGDFNYDGWNDLVWHAPGCSKVYIWLMNGTTRTGTVTLPNVGNDWRLIGAGDFTKDNRPDLAWRQASTGNIGIWKMLGTTLENWNTVITMSADKGEATMVADLTDDGKPDFLTRKLVQHPVAGASYTYWIQQMDGKSLGSFWQITDMGSIDFPGGIVSAYNYPVGVGRYNSDRHVDLAWVADAPTGGPRVYNHFFYLWNGFGMSDTSKQATDAADFKALGPR